MPLQSGTRLGPYEVLTALGAGGMGEVYLARDTRLDRRVAVKVLAPELAADPDFQQRFAREARAISRFNHPHICRLYDLGVGDQHDVSYLVLELVEGESLAVRLARGALPPAQVLRFAIQMAEALEAAHAQGIVHRDLKPANVMLTPAGVKLLDFGVAKRTNGAGHGLSALSTAPPAATAEGTIVGTVHYMAPEQLQGGKVDPRSDLFAFGAVVYEMATGRKAFDGATRVDVIGKILETEPPAISSLVRDVPAALEHVVQGCLAKLPADRWQAAHDVKLQLQWIERQASDVGAATARTGVLHRTARWVPWAIAVASIALVAALQPSSRPAPLPTPRLRFDLILPSSMWQLPYHAGAISPNGDRFVFEAMVDGRQQLVVRDMETAGLTVLGGTDMAFTPFWASDSGSVGFFHPGGHLKAVDLAGGPARIIADAKYTSADIGGTWRGGVILFGSHDGQVYRVSEAGGKANRVKINTAGAAAEVFAAPRFLPDGRHFLLSASNEPGVYLASLDAPDIRRLIEDGTSANYAAGHVFYSRGTTLFARPFDVDRLAFVGSEMQVGAGVVDVSASDSGTIAYRPTGFLPSALTWYDRNGRRSVIFDEPGRYDQVVLSPSARRATVVRLNDQGNVDLWDADLTSGIFSRLTTHPAYDGDPAWAPDERALAFTSFRSGRGSVYIKDLNTGSEKQLVASGEEIAVDQWTPDGRFIVCRTFGKAVYVVSLTGDRTPQLLADTPYVEDEVRVSPDGRWVAYNADESGRWEVYVAAFPSFTLKRQVSSAGGVQPQWAADRKELFYLGLDGSMMSVRVTTGDVFTASPPQTLFKSRMAPNASVPQYGVTADGERFLGLERLEGDRSFTFLVNWLKTN